MGLKKLIKKKSRIAVGTTSLRVLESCYDKAGVISIPKGESPFSTDIFLYPGVAVNSIRGLITNFHLPKINSAYVSENTYWERKNS